MKTFSTPQVAAAVLVDVRTLERWIAAGKIKPSRVVRVGNRTTRLWSRGDLARVRAWKAAHYRKGRGRKKSGQGRRAKRRTLP